MDNKALPSLSHVLDSIKILIVIYTDWRHIYRLSPDWRQNVATEWSWAAVTASTRARSGTWSSEDTTHVTSASDFLAHTMVDCRGDYTLTSCLSCPRFPRNLILSTLAGSGGLIVKLPQPWRRPVPSYPCARQGPGRSTNRIMGGWVGLVCTDR